jgi:Polysaccharide deacetylase
LIEVDKFMRSRHWLLGILVTLALVDLERSAFAGDEPTWSWLWRSSAVEQAPKVEVCPLLYDKGWAYTVEIDDGPASTLNIAQPLLARFAFTDAPPGLKGGNVLPFVGGAAVMVQWVGTSNPTHLDWEQLRELERRGWGVLNHSYWHTGNHWDPSQALKPADFRRELYWSRALLETILGEGRGDAHFVFPSGDFHYGPYLDGAGIRSASRVGGTTRSIHAEPAAFCDLDRNWLDESVWAMSGDPMQGFPKPGPKTGDLVIDFTHEIEPGSDSKNHRRWVERLANIANRFGKDGDDTIWSAPTTDIVRYILTVRVAKVEVEKGRLTVRLPDGSPVSPLTLKITGLDERSDLEAPPGGTLYRKGNQAWITTPKLGSRKTGMMKTPLNRVYQGPVQDVAFDGPRAIAGVRLLQQGQVAGLRIDLIQPDGSVVSLLTDEQKKIKDQWGAWLLFPTLPNRPAIIAKGVRVDTDPGLKGMEVWAVEDGARP